MNNSISESDIIRYNIPYLGMTFFFDREWGYLDLKFLEKNINDILFNSRHLSVLRYPNFEINEDVVFLRFMRVLKRYDFKEVELVEEDGEVIVHGIVMVKIEKRV